MQHIPLHAIFIALTVSAASAGPLTLSQDGYPVNTLAGAGSPASPQRPAPAQSNAQLYAQANQVRPVASNGPNFGGGFFEVLFGGAGNRYAPQQQYEPTQRTEYGYAPSADPAQPAV